MLVTFFVVSLAPATREPIFSSPSGRLVGNAMNAVGPVLPTEAREALAPFIAEAKQAIAAGEKILPLLPLQQNASSKPAKEADAGTVERR